jgi:hypothetical protein
MSQKRQARRASRDRAQALAKLHALERLYVAGLIDDRTHATRLARLQAELDAADAVEDLARWAQTQGDVAAPPRSVQPEANAVAPPASPPAAVPPPDVVAPPASRRAMRRLADVAAPEGRAVPAPARRGRPGRRGALVASATAVAVVAAGTVTAVLATRGSSHPATSGAAATTSPVPRASPTGVDSAAALATLRAAPPRPDGAVIDAGHAETLVRAFWSVREQALLARDRAAVSGLDVGAAVETDSIGCTAACGSEPRPLAELRVFVPREIAFPAGFLAEALTTTAAGDVSAVERMVFARASRTALWSLALSSTTTGAEHLDDAPETEASGFDAAPPLLRGSLPPSQLPGALAAYYQQWAQHGAAPAGTAFAPGTFTTALGGSLRQRVEQDAASGALDTVRYDTDPARDGTWTFATSALDSNGLPVDGWSITCASVRYQRVSVPVTTGKPLVQAADRSRFGPLLVPGSYRRVTVSGVQQVCIEEQPRFASLVVVGGDPQDTAAVGA